MFEKNIKLLSKYQFNQVLFGVNCLIFLFLWVFIWQNFGFFENGFLNLFANFKNFGFSRFFHSFFSFDNFSWNLQTLFSNFWTNSFLILVFIWQFLHFFGIFTIIIIAFSINLHYFMNLVHLSSHRLLSKSKVTNSILGNLSAIFCGLTLADFTTTHLLHHSFLHTDRDPDRMIARAPHFLILPFFILWHDFWFWQNGLWRQNRFIGYFTDRIAQIGLVLLFWYFDKLNLWFVFWLLPIYLVGFFNGMFLFYFPHFQTNWERKKRQQNIGKIEEYYQKNSQNIDVKNDSKKELNSAIKIKIFENEIGKNNNSNNILKMEKVGIAPNKLENIANISEKNETKTLKTKLNYFDQFGLFIIDLSRHSHALHHEKIHSNWAYFPIITKLFKPEILIKTNKFIQK